MGSLYITVKLTKTILATPDNPALLACIIPTPIPLLDPADSPLASCDYLSIQFDQRCERVYWWKNFSSGCGCHFIQFLTFARSRALGSCMEALLQGDYYRFYMYSSYWTLAVYLCTCIRASGVVRFRACEKVGVLGLAQSSTFWSVFYATNASGSLNCSNCARAVATFSLPLVCEVSWAATLAQRTFN